MKVKYIYATSREYTSAVYQTQIIDWLNLYLTKGVEFELWHIFTHNFNYTKRAREKRKSQIMQIRHAYNGRVTTRIRTHNKYLTFLNKWLFLRSISRALNDYDKVVFFSRSILNPEIAAVKKKFGDRFVYYLDLRGALAEEKYLTLKKGKNFTFKGYNSVAKMAFQEYCRQKLADKIFVVTNSLKNYYIKNFDADKDKFVLYPCLSSSKKFYYNPDLRKAFRKELKINESDNIYIYSGGLRFTWHIPDTFLRLFIEIAKNDENAKLLIISPSIPEEIKSHIKEDAFLSQRIILKEAVPNEEVVNYLNAADFGFLLRENNPVNNVASPSKYAEYILCGLPTIISEGIFDYALFCKENKCGYVITDVQLEYMKDITPLQKCNYDRNHIARVGKELLSKESAVDRILFEMTNICNPQ